MPQSTSAISPTSLPLTLRRPLPSPGSCSDGSPLGRLSSRTWRKATTTTCSKRDRGSMSRAENMPEIDPGDTYPHLISRPTPVEAAPRLARAIGLEAEDLWIKRDDLTGLGGGGNKARKLERTAGAARAHGATTLVTSGAAQSNHARLTAAAGARLGMDV